MPIRITCPHCKRGMLVDERLAGKKGRCKACQQPLTVPPLPTSNNSSAPQTASAPAEAQTAAPTDFEAEAAALSRKHGGLLFTDAEMKAFADIAAEAGVEFDSRQYKVVEV